MGAKQVVAGVKARYTSTDEVELALREVGDVARADVLRGLEALLEPTTLASEPFKLACAFFVGVVKLCPDRALFAPLVKTLPRAKHATTREALVRAAPIVNNLAEHPVLVTQLHSDDENTRTAAMRILEKVAVAQTLDVLAADFKSATAYAGASAVLAQLLEKFGARASPIAFAALSANDLRMQLVACEAIARAASLIADKRAFLDVVRPRVRDPDDASAAAAIGCFAALCEDPDDLHVTITAPLELGGPLAVTAALRAIARFPTPALLLLLEPRLMRGPSRISVAALAVLQEIANDHVLPPLVAAIAHRRQRVRTEAVRVFKTLAAQEKVDVARAVLHLFRSRDPNVRRMGSEVLQAMGRRAALMWPRLIAFIRDEDWWVRERLADALVPMATSELVPHVTPLLDDPQPGLRRFAVQTLGRIGDPQALAAMLVRARDDADWLVREHAVRAIGSFGDARAVPYLVKLADVDGLAVAALDALGKLKKDDARGKVGAFLARPERDVRMAALKYARLVDAREHTDAIVALLSDVDAEIAQTAAATLRAWQYPGVQDPSLDEAGRLLGEILRKAVKANASDVILLAGRKVTTKRSGRVEPLTQRELTAENVYELLAPLLSAEQLDGLAHKQDVDLSYDNPRVGARFRVNVFQGSGGLGAVFRVVRSEVLPLEKLAVPPVVTTFADLENGLVLFGGPPGSGKSTTLAGIIDRINQHQSRHIICIEDPIEAVHQSVRSLITQRELGMHTSGYGSALRAALREDPDVILVGEMRDLETIQFALTAAETGHLVFGTVHAVAADSCVERVINAFPAERQAQVRGMLADSLRAIVCQHLLPRTDGGRVLACEVMLNSESIANLIRKGAPHQIASQMVLQRETGTQLMDDALDALVRGGVVDVADAYVKARDKGRFPVPEDAAVAPVAPLVAPVVAPTVASVAAATPNAATILAPALAGAPSPPAPRGAVLANAPGTPARGARLAVIPAAPAAGPAPAMPVVSPDALRPETLPPDALTPVEVAPAAPFHEGDAATMSAPLRPMELSPSALSPVEGDDDAALFDDAETAPRMAEPDPQHAKALARSVPPAPGRVIADAVTMPRAPPRSPSAPAATPSAAPKAALPAVPSAPPSTRPPPPVTAPAPRAPAVPRVAAFDALEDDASALELDRVAARALANAPEPEPAQSREDEPIDGPTVPLPELPDAGDPDTDEGEPPVLGVRPAMKRG